MRRVVKLGGSLLTRVNLRSTMQAWISRQPPTQTLVIVGGGDIVDAVRRLDAIQPLAARHVHQMCIDLLQVTFEFAQAMFDDWGHACTASELEEVVQTGIPGIHLVAVHAFYTTPFDSSGTINVDALPTDWRTTSDTLAALLAKLTSADELVLLKSCDVPDVGIAELSRLGIVDEAFPEFLDPAMRCRVERLL